LSGPDGGRALAVLDNDRRIGRGGKIDLDVLNCSHQGTNVIQGNRYRVGTGPSSQGDNASFNELTRTHLNVLGSGGREGELALTRNRVGCEELRLGGAIELTASRADVDRLKGVDCAGGT